MAPTIAAGVNRRRFLLGSSAFGLAAGLAAGLPPAGLLGLAGAQAATLPANSPAWDKLEKLLTGPLLRQGDSRYPIYAPPFNLYYDTPDRQPTALALCANEKDVATAVRWAADNGLNPVVRGGGHSYAGYSMGPGLMINVSIMKRFSWNRGRKLLTVESGARNGDVYGVLRSENRTLTHGRCPAVGLAGFLLGGGIGFGMRRFGVGSDNMLATDVVTADGKVRHASPRTS